MNHGCKDFSHTHVIFKDAECQAFTASIIGIVINVSTSLPLTDSWPRALIPTPHAALWRNVAARAEQACVPFPSLTTNTVFINVHSFALQSIVSIVYPVKKPYRSMHKARSCSGPSHVHQGTSMTACTSNAMVHMRCRTKNMFKK